MIRNCFNGNKMQSMAVNISLYASKDFIKKKESLQMVFV